MKHTTSIVWAVVLGLILQAAPVYAAGLSPDSFSGSLQNFAPASDTKSSSNLLETSRDFTPQQCKQNGDRYQGDRVCKQVISQDSMVTSESHFERGWNELKTQTTIKMLKQGRIMDQRIVRHRIAYTDDYQTVKTRESFDIVNYPLNKQITREVLILEFAADGETIKDISYAKYDQIEDLAFAALTYNVSLSYDEQGMPRFGKAEHWKEGVKSKDLYRWDSQIEGLERFDGDMWRQWENMIKQASIQEALF